MRIDNPAGARAAFKERHKDLETIAAKAGRMAKPQPIYEPLKYENKQKDYNSRNP
ncbi:hypothetical protein GOV06_02570 [Candidatus Woesearchaeota archaeon]|nr:hypothetical protein [Candidatus Woesearchaeota archaeon]